MTYAYEYEEFDDLDALRDAVEGNHGVLTLQAWQIRNAYGAERLGTQVRTNIDLTLVARAQGTIRRSCLIVSIKRSAVFQIASPAGAIIEVASTPGDARGHEVARPAAEPAICSTRSERSSARRTDS